MAVREMNNAPHLDSVSARIAASIIKFCQRHVGGTFRADELRGFVLANVGTCAPGSADRILRNLRQKGALDYTVIDRSKSLYLLRSVNPAYDLI